MEGRSQSEGRTAGLAGLLHRLDAAGRLARVHGLRPRRAPQVPLGDLDRLPPAVGQPGEDVDEARPALPVRVAQLVQPHGAVDVLALESGVAEGQEAITG